MVSLIPILFIFSYLPISYKNTFNNSDGNGVGFCGYLPRPAPNGTGLKFNPGRGGYAGMGIPMPAPSRLIF